MNFNRLFRRGVYVFFSPFLLFKALGKIRDFRVPLLFLVTAILIMVPCKVALWTSYRIIGKLVGVTFTLK